jgi:hypothetical protein
MITNLSDLSVINYNQCITVRYLQCTAKSMDPETLAQRARRRRETSQHIINAVLLILTHIIAVIVSMLIDMLHESSILSKATISYFSTVWVWLGYGDAKQAS